MSRWEFMRKLEELLSDISPGEREEALKYYNDYINDGGTENEAKVLESLGTPEQVAAIIKEGLEGGAGEFTESGFYNSAARSSNSVTHYQEPASYTNPSGRQSARSGMSAGVIALIVVLCVLASPLILGLGGGLFGVLAGIIIGALAIIFSIAVIAFLCIVLGIVAAVIGIFGIFASPLGGLTLMAVGLITCGIGLLFLLLTVLIFGKLLPAIFKGIIYLFECIFGKKKGAQNA
ncbi:MAG: hypothetical protein FWC09_05465 [Lachnospiraceae bacterium]|nr:hypothetical protein [Lachnospiraceae bacterium]